MEEVVVEMEMEVVRRSSGGISSLCLVADVEARMASGRTEEDGVK